MSATFLYCEINAVGAIILFIILKNLKKSTGTTAEQQAFINLIRMAVVILVFDSLMWLIDKQVFTGARALNIGVTSVYYFFNGFIPFLWFVYTAIYFNEHNLFFRKYRVPVLLPLALNTLHIVINFWSHTLFTVDENNVYRRGPWFLLTVFLCFSYLVASAVISWSKAKSAKTEFERSRCIAISRFLVLPTIGVLIQMLYFGATVLWICAVLSCLMIYVNVQNTQISTDALTGLNNRYQFDKYLHRMFTSEELRSKGALIMIDVDKFKHINDTYGHICGDRALCIVAGALKRACGSSNAFLARYGGDEFAIICKQEIVESLIQTVRENIRQQNAAGELKLSLSLSMGAALFTEEGIGTVDELIALADARMYEQKKLSV